MSPFSTPPERFRIRTPCKAAEPSWGVGGVGGGGGFLPGSSSGLCLRGCPVQLEGFVSAQNFGFDGQHPNFSHVECTCGQVLRLRTKIGHL